ncbi:MAG: lipid A phosphate methyltransferase, partial [Candidatus Cloacimonetes bacterium]|nr:lipid A phosphate methyltransferase [Candidatus Cloacimonadota bacterium]
VSSLGLFIRVITIGSVPRRTSGRNVVKQVAETLNTKGIYSTCRHPLYLGNFFMHFGIVMLTRSWWLIPIYPILYWFYYERIMLAEEDFLISKFGEVYLEWANRTPAFIPRFSSWQATELSFSMRTVLRREYSGLFAMVLSLAIVSHLTYFARSGQFVLQTNWLIAIGSAGVIYITLRTLKRKTRLLHEAGR